MFSSSGCADLRIKKNIEEDLYKTFEYLPNQVKMHNPEPFWYKRALDSPRMLWNTVRNRGSVFVFGIDKACLSDDQQRCYGPDNQELSKVLEILEMEE